MSDSPIHECFTKQINKRVYMLEFLYIIIILKSIMIQNPTSPNLAWCHTKSQHLMQTSLI